MGHVYDRKGDEYSEYIKQLYIHTQYLIVITYSNMYVMKFMHNVLKISYSDIAIQQCSAVVTATGDSEYTNSSTVINFYIPFQPINNTMSVDSLLISA